MTENERATAPEKAAAAGPCEEALGRESVRAEQALFERDLARTEAARLGEELRRLERRVAQLDADRGSLQARLDERERYVGAIHASGGWKLLQSVRGLFGRRW